MSQSPASQVPSEQDAPVTSVLPQTVQLLSVTDTQLTGQYAFAGLGMALGGWLGGVVFDNTGGYTNAFLAGFGLNVMNLCVVGALFARHSRSGGLRPVPA